MPSLYIPGNGTLGIGCRSAVVQEPQSYEPGPQILVRDTIIRFTKVYEDKCSFPCPSSLFYIVQDCINGGSLEFRIVVKMLLMEF